MTTTTTNPREPCCTHGCSECAGSIQTLHEVSRTRAEPSAATLVGFAARVQDRARPKKRVAAWGLALGLSAAGALAVALPSLGVLDGWGGGGGGDGATEETLQAETEITFENWLAWVSADGASAAETELLELVPEDELEEQLQDGLLPEELASMF